jgi:hypothetical protein
MKELLVSFYTNVLDSDSQRTFALKVILDNIRSCYWGERVDALRAEPEKAKQDALKKQMPGVTFAGVFARRNKIACTAFTGLVTLDFDSISNPAQIVRAARDHTSTVAAFISPRGEGAKIIVLTDAKIDTYPAAYQYVKAEYERHTGCIADKSGADISRLCFVSADANAYINYNATALHIPPAESAPALPVRQSAAPVAAAKLPGDARPTEDAPVAERLAWAERCANKDYRFVAGQRNNFVNQLAFYAHRLGCDYSDIMFYIDSNHFVSDDFPRVEIERTVYSATENLAAKGEFYRADRPAVARARNRETKQAAAPSGGTDKDDPAAAPYRFWDVNDRGIIRFDHMKVIEWLENEGFCRYQYANKAFDFIRVQRNVVHVVTVAEIKQHCREALESMAETNVLSKLIKEEDKHLSKSKLEWLPILDDIFVRDTSEYVHIFYADACIRIDMFSCATVSYDRVGGYVWRDWILNRPAPIYKPGYVEGDFWDFLTCVSGEKATQFRPRKEALAAIFGYLVSRYKDAANAKAVVLCDSAMPEMKGEANGGTGKSLFGVAVSHIRPVIRLGGHELQKYVKGETQFALQRVSTSTCVLDFNDLPPKFPFQSLFNAITDDLIVERKGMAAVMIPFETSPKILIATNETVPDKGNSYERRKVEFEFSPYFNRSHVPKDEFKRLFFSEWDTPEWGRFDCAVIACVQTFLREGLAPPKPVNLQRRKLMDATCLEFSEFAYGIYDNENGNEKILRCDVRYNVADLLATFNQYFELKETPDVQTFGKWLAILAQVKRWNMKRERAGKNKPSYVLFESK